MNKIVVFVFLIVSKGFLFAQSSADCMGAVSICDTIYYLPSLPDSFNNTYLNEINPSLSCINDGGDEGVWFKFATVDTGMLSFTIFPIDTTYDFDWTLFQLHYVPCSQIFGDTSLLISCDNSGINGTDGSTGADGLIQLGHRPTIHVANPSIYYLYISSAVLNPTDTLGYTIDFSNSTITLEDCGEIGLDEPDNSKLFKLFPNPAHDFLYINSEDKSTLVSRFEIFSLDGKKIKSESVNQLSDFVINIQDISVGVYSLCIHLETGQMKYYRIIID